MVREGYKETELGEIPEEWDIVELNCISSIEMGQSPPSSTYNDNMIGIPFFQGCGNFGSKNPIIKQYCSKPLKISNWGDILISVRAPVGELNLSNVKCCIGRGLASISNKPNSEPIFLYYSLLHLKRNLHRLAVGSTFEAINSAVLNKFILPFPSLSEQHRIATVLSTIDECIEKTEALIAKLNSVKAGLMQDLLTRGIDAEGRIRDETTHEFKDTEIGRVPVEWEVKKLDEITDPNRQITYGIVQAGPHIENGIPYIRSSDLNDSEINLSTLLRTSQEIALMYRRSEVYPDDIIFSLRGNIGTVKIVPQNIKMANLTQGTARIACGKNINNQYLLTALSSNYCCKQIRSMQKGSTFQEISLQMLRNFYIFVPSFMEQQKIANIWINLDNRMQYEEKSLNKLNLQKKGLMADLLTGTVRTPEGVL